MKILHLHPADFATARWAGGTTTELFLYPEGGSYAARDFVLRISSATVELEESDFTALPGVERYITPLVGGFTLTHPGLPPVSLRPADPPYRFSGAIPTHCLGRATDFNLMLRGCAGEMRRCEGSARLLPGLNALYPLEDTVFSVETQNFELKKGELLVIFADGPLEIRFVGSALLCYGDIAPGNEKNH